MPTLADDDEARAWYWRRWVDDESVRIQRHDGTAWLPVYKVIIDT